VYSIPSLALFAVLIPVTGLGRTTAIVVLTAYNQYLLLRSFTTGLREADGAVVEAARGIGMTEMQILTRVQIPLAKRALFAGLRLAVVSTIGIGTIAASINAGGLETLLFEGLRTMNTAKILWGSLLSAGLAIVVNALLKFGEERV
jgi:osmoprotectant transport system permease protein